MTDGVWGMILALSDFAGLSGINYECVFLKLQPGSSAFHLLVPSDCMAAQHSSAGTSSLTDHYSILEWLAAGIVGLLTIPVGLLVPGYFYMKASNGNSGEHTSLEIWTVILLGIFGIAAVELGGRKGAKILWGLALGVVLLVVVLAVILGVLVMPLAL